MKKDCVQFNTSTWLVYSQLVAISSMLLLTKSLTYNFKRIYFNVFCGYSKNSFPANDTT